MKILVPFDDSIDSKKAAEYAISISRKYGSSVTFLAVIIQDCNPSFSDIVVNEKEYVLFQGEMINIKIANAGLMLDDLVESLRCEELDIEFKIIVGFPHPEIVRTAKRGNYDLIVMGYRGLSASKRFFLGSVAKRVIIDAPCSVLVVK